jgi:hypothetical protein
MDGDGQESGNSSPVDDAGEHEPSATRNEQLDAIANLWKRRGYRESYVDEYLVQLVGRARFGWASLPYLMVKALALAIAVVAFIEALRHRPWHTITLVRRPDGRIISHTQRSPHPPVI